MADPVGILVRSRHFSVCYSEDVLTLVFSSVKRIFADIGLVPEGISEYEWLSFQEEIGHLVRTILR